MLDVSKLSPTIGYLQSALDGLSTKQQVISNNIANVDTPGFKGSDVDFETQLRQVMTEGGSTALTATNPAHFKMAGESTNGASVSVQQDDGFTMRNDGNSVDIDKEMANLAETTIRYDALSQMISAKFSGLKSVIREGRS